MTQFIYLQNITNTNLINKMSFCEQKSWNNAWHRSFQICISCLSEVQKKKKKKHGHWIHSRGCADDVWFSGGPREGQSSKEVY